jgi:hypothetical protein
MEYNVTVHQLFIYFKKAYDSVKKEVLHDILTQSCTTMSLAGKIKICLNET